MSNSEILELQYCVTAIGGYQLINSNFAPHDKETLKISFADRMLGQRCHVAEHLIFCFSLIPLYFYHADNIMMPGWLGFYLDSKKIREASKCFHTGWE